MTLTLMFMLACDSGETTDTHDSHVHDDTGSENTGSEDTGSEDTGDTGEPAETVQRSEDGGVISFVVDGSDSEAWVYVDFATGQVSESDAWDVALQRYAMNLPEGGVAGWQPDESFDALSAPIAGLPWDSDPGAWWAYDSTTHVLSPLAGSFALELDSGTWLLEWTGYYHPETGASGYPQFQVKAADAAPESKLSHESDSGVRTTEVDASDGAVTLRLASGAEATAANPDAWNLSFDRYNVTLNDVQVAITDEAFDGLASLPADLSWDADMSAWYDYDSSTHQLSAKEQTYLLQSGDGGVYKLEFTSYYDADGVSGHPTFRWAEVLGE